MRWVLFSWLFPLHVGLRQVLKSHSNVAYVHLLCNFVNTYYSAQSLIHSNIFLGLNVWNSNGNSSFGLTRYLIHPCFFTITTKWRMVAYFHLFLRRLFSCDIHWKPLMWTWTPAYVYERSVVPVPWFTGWPNSNEYTRYWLLRLLFKRGLYWGCFEVQNF